LRETAAGVTRPIRITAEVMREACDSPHHAIALLTATLAFLLVTAASGQAATTEPPYGDYFYHFPEDDPV
jgi:hypothetical protein